MSRDYDCYCPECAKNSLRTDNAREGHLADGGGVSKYQVQCLNPECGCNFIKTVTTKYVKLKVKGITEKDWEKAYKEIFCDHGVLVSGVCVVCGWVSK